MWGHEWHVRVGRWVGVKEGRTQPSVVKWGLMCDDGGGGRVGAEGLGRKVRKSIPGRVFGVGVLGGSVVDRGRCARVLGLRVMQMARHRCASSGGPGSTTMGTDACTKLRAPHWSGCGSRARAIPRARGHAPVRQTVAGRMHAHRHTATCTYISFTCRYVQTHEEGGDVLHCACAHIAHASAQAGDALPQHL